MATCITFGIQKGGVGKTTTAALSSWLLSRKSRVLAVDMDSQGNLTQVLSLRPPESFAGRTVLEALKRGRADTYIHRIEENLHLLPADDLLQTFDGSPDTLRGILEGLRSSYDFIIVDQPPALSPLTLNALGASDAVVVLCQTEPLCFDALPRYIDTLMLVRNKLNDNRLFLAGILLVMLDKRASLDRVIARKAMERFGTAVFQTVITWA